MPVPASIPLLRVVSQLPVELEYPEGGVRLKLVAVSHPWHGDLPGVPAFRSDAELVMVSWHCQPGVCPEVPVP